MNTLAFINGQSGLFLMLALILLFGAKKLPELAKGLGQSIREFKKGKDDDSDDATPDNKPLPPT